MRKARPAFHSTRAAKLNTSNRQTYLRIGLLFLAITQLPSAWATLQSMSITGVRHLHSRSRLTCMTCVIAPGDTTQLDQFRVRQNLMEPFCEMEPVECSPQQDTCVTVTMQVAAHRFWMGAGCDQRVNYDIASDREGCADMQTFTRSIQPGYVEERRAYQQVCLCSGQMCNDATSCWQCRIPIIFALLYLAMLRI